MSTLHVSEKTNHGMQPQFLALESTPADKPEVGTKRGVQTRSADRVAGVNHGRGETGNGAGNLSLRHPVGVASAIFDGGVRGTVSVDAVPTTAPGVFVGAGGGRPLMPWCPARARRLLRSPRARVHHLTPFVIRLVDRLGEDSVVTGVEVGIDPGSKSTGVAVTTATPAGTVGLVSFEIRHRGRLISKKLELRSNYPPVGGAGTSGTGHRGSTIGPGQRAGWPRASGTGWTRPCHPAPPVGTGHRRRPRAGALDMANMENPEITGAEYTQGTLGGYEAREYLLAKWGRTCAYCGATNTPLNLDHFHPKAAGGSIWMSNLALGRILCNQSKGSQDLTTWLVAKCEERVAGAILNRVRAQSKAPLKDADSVNATRWALHRELCATGPAVAGGSDAPSGTEPDAVCPRPTSSTPYA